MRDRWRGWEVELRMSVDEDVGRNMSKIKKSSKSSRATSSGDDGDDGKEVGELAVNLRSSLARDGIFR